jgi:hypothetical protein
MLWTQFKWQFKWSLALGTCIILFFNIGVYSTITGYVAFK